MTLIKTGSTGVLVQHLQNSLNFLGMAEPALNVDGIFGPKTRAAVVKFQQFAKVAPDGIVGPKTSQALAAAVLAKLIGSAA